MQPLVRMLSSLALGATTACAGVQYHFDPEPAPSWIRNNPEIKQSLITAVGTAPATPRVNTDLELATRDASRQIGLMFESQVKSSATDWSLAVKGGEGTREVSMLDNAVRVSTSVKVEGLRVEESYRDEPSRTHYVRTSVDGRAWVQKLTARVREAFASLDQTTSQASGLLDQKAPVKAQTLLGSAYTQAARVEPDVVVLGLLTSGSGPKEELRQRKTALDALSTRLRKDHCFAFAIQGDARAGEMLTQDLTRFFSDMGFQARGKGGCAAGAITIKATVGQRFLRDDTVADRVEHVHEPSGSLEVTQPSGDSIAELLIEIPAGSLNARDVESDRAAAKALELGATTLAGQLRSRYRSILAE